MSDTPIIVENLSKSYLVGHKRGDQSNKRHTTLRDVIGDNVRNFYAMRLIVSAADKSSSVIRWKSSGP